MIDETKLKYFTYDECHELDVALRNMKKGTTIFEKPSPNRPNGLCEIMLHDIGNASLSVFRSFISKMLISDCVVKYTTFSDSGMSYLSFLDSSADIALVDSSSNINLKHVSE